MFDDSAPTAPVAGGVVPSPKQAILESELQVAEVGDRPLSGDAESAVFELPHDPTLAARIYARPTPELAERLAAMIANPPADSQVGQGQPAFAWPTDRLLEVGSFQTCLGYAMKWVRPARTLEHLCDSSARLMQGPVLDYGQLLHVSRRLAAAFSALHTHGHAVGPVRPSRILIGDTGLVTLADAASLQIKDGSRVFPCPGGPAAYDAPESQQARSANTKVERGPQQDAFTLAVLIYRLLTLGDHPLLHSAPDAERRVPESLPVSVGRLFQECFGPERERPELRPDAARWEVVLAEAEEELTSCSIGARHRYPRELTGCPWCERLRTGGTDPFPAHLPTRPETTLLGRQPARVATGMAVTFSAENRQEGAIMSDGIDDFELEVDSTPEVKQPNHSLPEPPPELPPPMALEFLPSPAADAPAPDPMSPSRALEFLPFPDAPPPVTPPPTATSPPRRSSLLPWSIGILLIALFANGILIAFWQGWIALPATRESTEKGTRLAKTEPTNKEPTNKPEETAPKKDSTAIANESTVEKKPNGKIPGPPALPKRPFLSRQSVLSAILDDLEKASPADRRFKRYLTLSNLHNNPSVTEAELELHRDALSGLIQHLAGTTDREILIPVGKERILYAIDLRRMGWSRAEEWREVLKLYPYALRHGESSDAKLAEVANKVYDLTDAEVPALRADWFMMAALTPPLDAQLSVKASGDPPVSVRSVVDRYRRPLALTDAAAELGLADAPALVGAIKSRARLHLLGLDPLAEGKSIPREAWAPLSGRSPYQETAKELDLGTPYNVR
jgi:hypothetical protein